MSNKLQEHFNQLEEEQQSYLPLNFKLATKSEGGNSYLQLVDGSFYRTKLLNAGQFYKPISKIISFKIPT